jgi:dienelactone hydrolase
MKNVAILILVTSFLLSPFDLFAVKPPSRPELQNHPSNSIYNFTINEKKWSKDNREIAAFIPSSPSGSPELLPVIVFGHGRGVGVEAYRLTFEHLAKKGIIVIHPEYAKDFFDKDFDRMAVDFNKLVEFALFQLEGKIDKEAIVYAGHSNGALVASKAAPKNSLVKNLLLIQPAGFDRTAIESLSSEVSITTIWSDKDTVVQEAHSVNIYQTANSKYKQYIRMKSYNQTTPKLEADHFISFSKSYIFGGKNGISPFHYYGLWNWLVASAQDLQLNARFTNPYLYGEEALETGLEGIQHEAQRNF